MAARGQFEKSLSGSSQDSRMETGDVCNPKSLPRAKVQFQIVQSRKLEYQHKVHVEAP